MKKLTEQYVLQLQSELEEAIGNRDTWLSVGDMNLFMLFDEEVDTICNEIIRLEQQCIY
jgi:hypothetical protein